MVYIYHIVFPVINHWMLKLSNGFLLRVTVPNLCVLILVFFCFVFVFVFGRGVVDIKQPPCCLPIYFAFRGFPLFKSSQLPVSQAPLAAYVSLLDIRVISLPAFWCSNLTTYNFGVSSSHGHYKAPIWKNLVYHQPWPTEESHPQTF